jgi:hypothetical protein
LTPRPNDGYTINMSDEHHPENLPPIPFTEAEYATMYEEDKKAAWDIARLTSGIFTFGLFLYSLVLIWMFRSEPLYFWR